MTTMLVKAKESDKEPKGSKRSGHWSTLRKQVLIEQPYCTVCKSKTKLEVHHIKSFHKHPELELIRSNLIVLCENKGNGLNCHLLIGHLGSFKSINENVIDDAATWNIKLNTRP